MLVSFFTDACSKMATKNVRKFCVSFFKKFFIIGHSKMRHCVLRSKNGSLKF